MPTSRLIPAALLFCCLLLQVDSGAATELRLSKAQETRLAGLLPKTMAKIQKRERIRVVSAGDSISTFYQPAGFPRYDSTMAWQGRLLSRLGGYYFYHTMVEMDPHREIANSRKESAAAWEQFKTDTAAWARTKKGPAPVEPDTLRFRADLESPVAMTVPQLIRRGPAPPEETADPTVIQILNLARDGAQSPQVLEALGPEAFPPPPAPGPDLVTICYGMNDAAASLPLESYRTFLSQAVALCLKNGAEVLVAAPPVSFDPDSPRPSLGRTRPYAQIAKEVAETAGVAFVDLGVAAVDAPSDLFSLTVEDAFSAATASIGRLFEYRSGIREILHPNSAATVEIGDHAARQLMDGPATGPVEVSGGVEVISATEATLILRFFNPSDTHQTIVVSPLSLTGWQIKPGNPDALFNLPPGKARRLNLPLEPSTAGPHPDIGAIRGSLLLTDNDRLRLVDVKLTVRPLFLDWPGGRYDAISSEFLVSPTLTNQSNSAVAGTATVTWRGQTQPIPVRLEPGQSMPLPLRLPLPDPEDTLRLLETVRIQIDIGEKSAAFERKVEGLRHLGLEERIPLVPPSHYPESPPPPHTDTGITPFADTRGLYFIIDAPSISGNAGEAGSPWGLVELQIDGRKAGENGTPGFVDRLSAVIPWTDGPVSPRKIRPAVFGHTYYHAYHPDGFRITATTRADGSRRIEFNIARVNLLQHEWSLDGSGQNTLGFSFRVTRFDPLTKEPDPSQTQILTLNGFSGNDARSLTVLELSRKPPPRWSLRVF